MTVVVHGRCGGIHSHINTRRLLFVDIEGMKFMNAQGFFRSVIIHLEVYETRKSFAVYESDVPYDEIETNQEEEYFNDI